MFALAVSQREQFARVNRVRRVLFMRNAPDNLIVVRVREILEFWAREKARLAV